MSQSAQGPDFSHFDESGAATMVDVGNKAHTARRALACGQVEVSSETLALIKSGGFKKGDVLSIAQLAGIMAAKQTATLIPLCHPLPLTSVKLRLSLQDDPAAVLVEAEAKTSGQTGVEMEALTAVSVACLTVYDMCKAVQKDMIITGIRLLEKEGGRSGLYRAP